MRTLASLLCGPTLLAACAVPAEPSAPRWPGEAANGHYDFNWQLSGDRAVAPLQVFHDGRDTWLHFAPGQPVPALFVQSGQGERVVSYQRQEPYVVVRGIWPALVMRGGRSQASARYLGSGLAPGADRAHAMALPDPGALAADTPLPAAQGSGPGPSSSLVPVSGGLADHPNLPAQQPTEIFHASPADGTMRALLRTWSRKAGWTFESEHWAVDVDIPLSGSASFGSGYQDAVRSLLHASEMGERPVQPCFYANRVLRVVPLNQACDRSADAAGKPA